MIGLVRVGVVMDWNEITLAAIRASNTHPPRAARDGGGQAVC